MFTLCHVNRPKMKNSPLHNYLRTTLEITTKTCTNLSNGRQYWRGKFSNLAQLCAKFTAGRNTTKK